MTDKDKKQIIDIIRQIEGLKKLLQDLLDKNKQSTPFHHARTKAALGIYKFRAAFIFLKNENL